VVVGQNLGSVVFETAEAYKQELANFYTVKCRSGVIHHKRTQHSVRRSRQGLDSNDSRL